MLPFSCKLDVKLHFNFKFNFLYMCMCVCLPVCQRAESEAATRPKARPAHSASSNIEAWLGADRGHGYIRVYPPTSRGPAPRSSSPTARSPAPVTSELVACTTGTTAHRVCGQLGVASNALHVQLNGGIVRRMAPHELPLVTQNDFLATLGYDRIDAMQAEGCRDELASLVKFYSGE